MQPFYVYYCEHAHKAISVKVAAISSEVAELMGMWG